MTELAQTCGISKPTLYHHFSDKYDVVQHLCKKITSEYYRQHSFSEIVTSGCSHNEEWLQRYGTFFKNILCYNGQNNLYICLTNLEMQQCLCEIRTKLNTDAIPEEIVAAMGFFAYSSWHTLYAVVDGRVSYCDTMENKASAFWPETLKNVFAGTMPLR